MDVLLRKSPFCPELTQILDLEETETHYGKSSIMAHSKHFKWRHLATKKFNFHAWGQKCHFRNCQFGTFDPVQFENFCDQIPSFEVLWMCHYETFSIMCLSLFQIQNLCQFWTKRWFSQKDIHTAFPFLFPSVLLSC